MAIILEERKSFKWGTVLMIIFLFGIIISGAYFLFFAPKPAIEVFVPAEQKITSELAKIDFNPASLIGNASFKILRPYSPAPTPGKTGRTNPFVKF